MSHENVEIVRRAIEALNRRDLTQIFDLFDSDVEVVVAGVTMRGKGKESGVAVESRVFSIWTLREAKVAHVVGGYRDRSEALEAAGLPT